MNAEHGKWTLKTGLDWTGLIVIGKWELELEQTSTGKHADKGVCMLYREKSFKTATKQ
jgi:hypothetical protein